MDAAHAAIMDRVSSKYSGSHEAQAMADLKAFLEEKDPNRRIELVRNSRFLSDAIKEKAATPEEVAQRMRNAAIAEGVTPDQVMVLGEHVAEIRENLYTDVSRLYEGATPETMIEERAHGDFKKALADGRLTMEEAIQAVREWAKEHPEFEIREDMTPAQVETNVHEAMADMIKARFFGNLKKIEGVPRSIRAWVHEQIEYFKAVFKRAATLKRLVDEGRISKNIDDFIAESVGLKVEKQIEKKTHEAAKELAGVTFSVKEDKGMREIEPDVYAEPSEVRPFHEVRDSAKLEKLVKAMEENGWVGRPLLAIDKGNEGFEALTGSHRLEAAKKAGLDEIPLVTIEDGMLDANEWEKLLDASDDWQRAEILREAGADRAADLMDAEVKANDSHSFSIITQADYVQRIADKIDALKGNPKERLAIYERAKARLDNLKLDAKIALNPAALKEMGKDAAGRAKLVNAIATLDAVVLALPKEVRGSLPVGAYKKLASYQQQAARINFLKDYLDRVDKAFERVLKNEYVDRIETLLDKSKPKAGDNGVKKSKLGPEAQELADAARKASLLDEDGTANRLKELSDAIDAGSTDPKLLQEWAIVNQFGDLKNRSSEQLAEAHKWLEDVAKTGRAKQRMLDEARFMENRLNQAAILKSLGKGELPETFRKAHSGVLTRMAEMGANFIRDHKSFEQFIRAVLPGMDKLAEQFANRMRKADNGAQDMVIAKREAMFDVLKKAASNARKPTGKALEDLKTLKENVAEVLVGRMVATERIDIELAHKIVQGKADPGKLSKADIETLRDELAALPADTRKEKVEIQRVISAGRNEKISMSRDQAIQILLSWRQKDVQSKMRRGGWMDSSIAELTKFVESDSVAKAIYEHLQQVYSESGKELNPVYSRMFGMNMPQVENYAPTRFQHSKNSPEIGLDGVPVSGGATPGFLVGRVSHSAPIAPKGALEVFNEQILMQSHWVNFAELARDFRALFANGDVRISLSKTFGDSVLSQIDAWASMMEKRGGDQARESAWLNWLLPNLISGRAVGSLGFNPKTIAMQMDSASRFLLAMHPREIAKAFTDPAGLVKAMPKVWFSDTVQRRLKGGMNPEMHFLFNRASSKPGIGTKIASIATAPMNFMDAVFTTIGSAAVFNHAYKEAIATGMKPKQAEAQALDALDSAVYRFSQPVGFGSKSKIENQGGLFSKIYMLFMSDPRLKTAVLAEAAEGLIKGRGSKAEHIKNIVVIEAMALASQVVANAYRDATTSDPDEDIWTAGGFARAALLAPFQGLFMVGSMADATLSRMFDEQWFAPSRDPLIDSANRAKSAVSHAGDTFNTSDPEAMLKQWNNISRAAAVNPSAAAPAAMLNLIKPIVGAKENLEKDAD